MARSAITAASIRLSARAAVALSLSALGLLFLSAACPEASAACGNESLRASLGSLLLPDCRAYEMVSPAYKEGYDILPLGASYSANGDEVIVYSLADLAGAQGAGEVASASDIYDITRAPDGWQLSPLNAPLSQFVGQVPLAVGQLPEVQGAYMLWKQHTPEQSATTRDLYVRSPAGDYSLIGPLGYDPRADEEEASNTMNLGEEGIARPVAATVRDEHVVLSASSPSDRWPFDTTEKGESLYEYSGTNNAQPDLVGVTGSKGSQELIRPCGVELGGSGGGGQGSVYNALSASGEDIFFTVNSCKKQPEESAEIYERLHGSLISSEEASTVDVSASECTGCGDESGKNFEGASENGERVFFTSTQRLTSDAVDGAASGNAVEEGQKGCSTTSTKTGGGCNLYEYVAAPESHRGHLETVASGEVEGVAGIAEDGAHVYFVSRSEVPGTGGEGPRDEGPREGGNNLYVYDASTKITSFIATLGEGDDDIWDKIFALKPVEVAGDEGQFLLFVSSTPELVIGDPTSVDQLFEYDAETGELERITKGEGGYGENGEAVKTGINPESINGIAAAAGEVDFKSAVNHLNISENGKIVFFETAGQLSERAPSAAQGCTSVYEFGTNGTLAEGSVHLISDGRDTQLNKGITCGAQFLAMDATGANVLFSTADELVPGDTDGVQRDIYDAREDGGFVTSSEESSRCTGSLLCEGPSTVPSLIAPTSEDEPGEAALPPPAGAAGKGIARAKRKTSRSPHKKRTRKKGDRDRDVKRRSCHEQKRRVTGCASTHRPATGDGRSK